jgi:1-acyl-sn-glycerol-3-phosphate acyltransferase
MQILIEIFRPVVRFFCRLMFRVQFHGVENVPMDGACVIASNHVTYADPVWINIPVRRQLYFMAWHQLFRIPGLGQLIRSLGAFPVSLDTADPSAHRTAIDLIRKGKLLAIFPEGGRGQDGKMKPFKMGAFRLALVYGVPIVPVTIHGADKIWPVGRFLPRPGRLKIVYHPPVVVEQAPPSITRAELKSRARILAQQIRAIMARELGEAEPLEAQGDEVLAEETG